MSRSNPVNVEEVLRLVDGAIRHSHRVSEVYEVADYGLPGQTC